MPTEGEVECSYRGEQWLRDDYYVTRTGGSSLVEMEDVSEGGKGMG